MDCMPFQMMMRIVVKYSSLFIPFQANHDLTQRGRIGTGPKVSPKWVFLSWPILEENQGRREKIRGFYD